MSATLAEEYKQMTRKHAQTVIYETVGGWWQKGIDPQDITCLTCTFGNPNSSGFAHKGFWKEFRELLNKHDCSWVMGQVVCEPGGKNKIFVLLWYL